MRLRRTCLAVALTFAANAAGGQTGRQTTVPPSVLGRAAWLAGCWEARATNRVTVEMWMPPMADLMLGGSRTVIGAAAREFEHLRLRARGDTLVYTAIPSGQKETDFRSTLLATDSLVFENPAHDFPRRISYRRVGADTLVARVEGPGPNNTTRGFSVVMRRADCTRLTPGPVIPPPDTVVMDAKVSPDRRTQLIVKGVGAGWDIYARDTNGAVRRLTDHAAVDYQPAWSPDGSRIAFASVRDGHQEIYTMRPDGSALTRLTEGSAHNSEPSWSPDGRHLAFRSEREGRPRIYVMNADGSAQRALMPGDTATNAAPAWSPDGRRILFASARSGRTEVYAVNADGSGVTPITQTAQGHSGSPSWSPDGRSILFWSSRDGNDDVYLMDADGSNPRNISRHAARDFPLGFTPDGAFVLFRSTRDRPLNDVYRMRLDGSEVTRETATPNLP